MTAQAACFMSGNLTFQELVAVALSLQHHSAFWHEDIFTEINLANNIKRNLISSARVLFFFPVFTRPILLQHFFAPYFHSSVCKCLPTRLIFLLHTFLFRKLKYDLITIQRRVPKRAHFKVDLIVRNVWHFDHLVVQPENKSIFLPLSDDVFLHDCFSERISLIKHICSENNHSPSNHKIGNDVQILQKFGFAVSDLDCGGFFSFSTLEYITPPHFDFSLWLVHPVYTLLHLPQLTCPSQHQANSDYKSCK